jgi:hypothetical protein
MYAVAKRDDGEALFDLTLTPLKLRGSRVGA